MVVKIRRGSGRIERRSAIGEAHERRQVGAASINFGSCPTAQRGGPWRLRDQTYRKATHVRLTLCNSPYGATGANRAAMCGVADAAEAPRMPSGRSSYIESNH